MKNKKVGGSLFLVPALAAALILAGPGGLSAHAAENFPQVLIINSYHQGEEWSDKEIEGLSAALKRIYPDLAPSIEHLDAKRFPGPSHAGLAKEYLKEKYRGRTMDLVLALDNPALDLLADFQAELFPDTPVVFAGVNNFKPEMLKGRAGVTGIEEFQDIEGSLDLALRLHPGTRRVLAVTDYTSSGLALREQMERVAPGFKGRIEILYSPDVSFPELAEQLKRLPPDALVLLLTYVTDRPGRAFARDESTRLISEACPVPVYSMHETRLGHGIIGGLLVEGREHGRQAGEIALRVLAGEPPSAIPVRKSHSSSVFDYKVLETYKIDLKALPPGSAVINRPPSFWQAHRQALIPLAWVFLAMFSLVGLLAVMIARLKKTEADLTQSRGKYRAVVENATEGILVVQDENIAFFNPAAAALAGYTPEEYRALTLDRLIHSGDIRAAGEKLRATLEGPAADPINHFRIMSKSGGVRWVEANSVRIEWEDKPALLVFLTDITARRQAQGDLDNSEKLLRTIAENFPRSYVFIIERDFSIGFASGMELRKTKAVPELFIGKTIDQLLGPQADMVRDRFQQTFGGLEQDFELHLNGRCWLCRTTPLTGDDGRVSRILTVVENISAQKTAEIALRDSEANLLSLIENSDGEIWAVDKEYRLVVGNNRFIENYSKSRGASLGKGDPAWLASLEAEAMAEWKGYYDRALGGAKFSVEKKTAVPAVEGWVEYRFNPIVDENKEITGLTVFGRETTTRRAAEERLKAALKEKEVLLQEVHHRVKNNMQVIISLLRLQAGKSDDPKIRDILRVCQGRVYAMAAVHEALYRSESLAFVDIKQYFSNLMKTLVGAYDAKSVSVDFSFKLDQPQISLKQAASLGLVFHELVSNTLKHAFPGGRAGVLSLCVGSRGPDLEMILSDNGVGFPESLDWRRADSLGLQIVVNLVENQLGGRIEHDGREGTTFTIGFRLLEPGGEGGG
ncbi:MAG: histidine kinase dimerization/phosphoacceptor domain -containing protein [Pseudomonadota bacterium]